MGMRLGVRLFCLSFFLSSIAAWGRPVSPSLILYDSQGNPMPEYQFTFEPKGTGTGDMVFRAISAQARGELAEGLNRYGQDAAVLGYAWSLLNNGTPSEALPKIASMPIPLSGLPIVAGRSGISVTGFINAAFNTQELFSFVSGMVGEGQFDLFSLQAPLEAVLNVLFHHYLQSSPGMGLSMGQADLAPVSEFIIQLYLASLIEGTEHSFPEAYAIVKDKQFEVMADLVTHVSGLARQLGGLRNGLASPPLEKELLKTMASAAPKPVFSRCIREIRERIAQTQDPEVDQLITELVHVANLSERGELKQSGLGVRILFTTITLFQRQIAVPIALLHLINGSSKQFSSVSTVPAVKFTSALLAQMTGLPIRLANEVTLTAYEAVEHFDSQLRADLQARYPGPGLADVLTHLFANVKTRYQQDLRYRQAKWSGLPVETCLEIVGLDAIN